jgi:hypothetical protein
MRLPGFTAEDSMYQKNHTYQGLALSSSISGDGGIRPECYRNPYGGYTCCTYDPVYGLYCSNVGGGPHTQM